MTALTYATVLLMAGMAVGLPTTAVLNGTNTTNMTTTAVNATWNMTTTPVPSAPPSTDSDFKCSFMWGSDYHKDDSTCTAYKMLDYGWLIFFILWFVFVILYAVDATWHVFGTCFPINTSKKLEKPEYVAIVAWLLFSFVWPAEILVLAGYLLYRSMYPRSSIMPGQVAPLPASTDAQSAPENAGSSGGGGGAASLTSRFNQRFPKIAPGDCRPKYTRVQTNAC